ncbi:MAG: VOC family protein [Actinobacteria bacterium]|nr:VOC family protein [Actinomycetota bacterium]
MQLHQVAQRARDLGPAIEFYRDVLGLRFIARFDPPGLAFFDMAGVFGAMGEEEWMAFCRDPDGNLVGVASRRPSVSPPR